VSDSSVHHGPIYAKTLKMNSEEVPISFLTLVRYGSVLIGRGSCLTNYPTRQEESRGILKGMIYSSPTRFPDGAG
jgi:hypothetical protein